MASARSQPGCATGWTKADEGSAALSVLGTGLVAMFFIAGLADVGIFFLTRSRAQIAADAAALAAAAELIPGLGTDPSGKAGEYARVNGAELLECECRQGSTYVEVQVGAPAAFFLVNSQELRRVTARAKAEVDLTAAAP